MKKECIDMNCVHCVRDKGVKVNNPLFAMYYCNEKRADLKASPDNCKHFKEGEEMETCDQSKNNRIGICVTCINNDALRRLCCCSGSPKMRIRNGETVECDGYEPVEVPVKKDMVNHPNHYQGDIEVIDYIRDKLTPAGFTDYCCGNVLKYVSRWRKKDGVQDLKKAKVYLEWMIESAEKE